MTVIYRLHWEHKCIGHRCIQFQTKLACFIEHPGQPSIVLFPKKVTKENKYGTNHRKCSTNFDCRLNCREPSIEFEVRATSETIVGWCSAKKVF